MATAAGPPSTTPSPSMPKPSAPDPSHRSGSFGRAAAITITITLLSRIIGMLRDMVIAHQFGVGVKTDAYNAAFTIPDLLMYLIAGGALSATFIPVFTDYLHKGDRRGAAETFSIVATVTTIAAIAFIVIGEIFAPQLVIVLNPGYSTDPDLNLLHPIHLLGFLVTPISHPSVRLELAAHMTRILLPAQLFFMVGSLMMGSLYARHNFLIPALGPIIYNLGIIVGATLLRRMDIYGLPWGALAGAFIGNFVLQALYFRHSGLRYRFNLNIHHPGVQKVWHLMLPILFGLSLPNVDQMINKYFSSELSAGSQTALMYAVRIMLIPIGVFAQAMGIAILPTLSAHVAAGKQIELRKSIVKGLRMVLFLAIPASVLMFILAEPIIAAIYQHGKFHYADTLRTASPLRYYAVGIFAWSAQAILTRSFYSVNDSRTPVRSGQTMTAIFIIMNWYIVHYTSWGVSGLAAATSIAATLHTCVMLFFLNKRIGKIASTPLAASVVKTIAATAALAVVTTLIYDQISPLMPISSRAIYALPVFALSAGAGFAAFIGMARLMKMTELMSVTDAIWRKLRRA